MENKYLYVTKVKGSPLCISLPDGGCIRMVSGQVKEFTEKELESDAIQTMIAAGKKGKGEYRLEAVNAAPNPKSQAQRDAQEEKDAPPADELNPPEETTDAPNEEPEEELSQEEHDKRFIDAVNAMSAAQLDVYAEQNFNIKLDRRKNIEDMRQDFFSELEKLKDNVDETEGDGSNERRGKEPGAGTGSGSPE